MKNPDKLKKAIIFDCDNTLWGGIVGEGGIIPDKDIQADAVFFANKGVIIGLCSKNNEEEVLTVLKDQILTEEYISAKRINWRDKASNLKEIAQELNIGLDAIMFVDDSHFEHGLIKHQLPEVLCIFPHELIEKTHEWFDLRGDFSKTKQYKDNYCREKAKEQFTDIDDYLASLQMVLHIDVNKHEDIPRITELTQKTNQFNLTTKRYTEEQIRCLMAEKVYSLSVKDKFGDNGIVGVAIVVGNRIDTFLLSCRVLGRGIEYAFFDKIMDDFKQRSWQQEVWADFKESGKNDQVEHFYKKLGFCWAYFVENKHAFHITVNQYISQAKNHFKYE